MINKILDITFGRVGTITINGKNIKDRTVAGRNIVINNGVLTVDGVVHSDSDSLMKEPELTIVVTGDVEKVATTNGNVQVAGSTKDVSTVNGNVTTQGNIDKASTVNGNIKAQSIDKASSVNGNIKV